MDSFEQIAFTCHEVLRALGATAFKQWQDLPLGTKAKLSDVVYEIALNFKSFEQIHNRYQHVGWIVLKLTPDAVSYEDLSDTAKMHYRVVVALVKSMYAAQQFDAIADITSASELLTEKAKFVSPEYSALVAEGLNLFDAKRAEQEAQIFKNAVVTDTLT